MNTTTNPPAPTIKNAKSLVSRVYNHVHKIGKSSFSTHQQAACAMKDFWSQLTFAGGSVGDEWQACALTMLTAIENEQYTGYDAVERLHSACGMLNQTIREATNLEVAI